MSFEQNKIALTVAAGAGVVLTAYLGWKMIRSLTKKSMTSKVEGHERSAPPYFELIDPKIDKRGYFLQQMRLGEHYLAIADFEQGVSHLANAMQVSDKRPHLDAVLKSSLPPPVYQMFLEAYKKIQPEDKAETPQESEKNYIVKKQQQQSDSYNDILETVE